MRGRIGRVIQHRRGRRFRLKAMSDWSTISSLATGAGTLVLAIATFAAVRSSNRSARIAEQTLQEQRQAIEEARRPLLVNSRIDDPVQKIMFRGGHWVRTSGGAAVAENLDDTLYFVMSLRNVGAGIAVLQGWHVRTGMPSAQDDHQPEEQFRLQTRDLYVPAGHIGLWQGALRDGDGFQPALAAAVDGGETITIELLYTDQLGAQRTISRFLLTPVEEGDAEHPWLISVNRHWYLDHPGPRDGAQGNLPG
jgi:hypothetical protein